MFLLAPSASSPEGIALASVCVHINIPYLLQSFFCRLYISLVDFQGYMSWPLVPWVGVLKVGSLSVEARFFPPHGEAVSWELPHSWMVLCWGLRPEGLNLSYQFQCGYFLTCLIRRGCSASFWISLKGNCFMCSCIFKYVCGWRAVQESPVVSSWTTSYICTSLDKFIMHGHNPSVHEWMNGKNMCTHTCWVR